MEFPTGSAHFGIVVRALLALTCVWVGAGYPHAIGTPCVSPAVGYDCVVAAANFTLRLPRPVRARLEAIARAEEVSLSRIVQKAVDRFIENHQNEPGRMRRKRSRPESPRSAGSRAPRARASASTTDAGRHQR